MVDVDRLSAKRQRFLGEGLTTGFSFRSKKSAAARYAFSQFSLAQKTVHFIGEHQLFELNLLLP